MAVSKNRFITEGQMANFTTNQLEFMWQFLAKVHHHHAIEEVEGLSDALVEAGVEPDDESEDELDVEFEGEDEPEEEEA